MNKKANVITLRVSDELAAKIADAVKKSGRDQADLLREAVSLGMDDLALIGLDPLNAAKEKIQAIKEHAKTLKADHLPANPAQLRSGRRSVKPNSGKESRV